MLSCRFPPPPLPKPHLPRYKHPPGQRERPGLVRLPLPQQRVSWAASTSLPAPALGIYGLLPRLLPLLFPVVRVVHEKLKPHPQGALQVSLYEGVGGGQLDLWPGGEWRGQEAYGLAWPKIPEHTQTCFEPYPT